jgi:hypothetical protein
LVVGQRREDDAAGKMIMKNLDREAGPDAGELAGPVFVGTARDQNPGGDAAAARIGETSMSGIIEVEEGG